MRRSASLIALCLAGVIVSAGECEFGDLGSIVGQPATITVTNLSASEPAVLAIIAGDVKSYPTLAAGASSTVRTYVGGTYQVQVVMTPENAATYRQSLMDLRRLVEQQIAGSTSSAEKTKLFADLAGLKAAIQALEQSSAAACSGAVTLKNDAEATVSATVTWTPQSGAGFWDATCGSD